MCLMQRGKGRGVDIGCGVRSGLDRECVEVVVDDVDKNARS